jgi:hypothetical protein
MRVEESESEVRLIKPSAERGDVRDPLICIAVMLGAFGTSALVCAWQQRVDVRVFLMGIGLSVISAWMLHQCKIVPDLVWTLVFNGEEERLEVAGRVVARFEDVRLVRCETDENSCHAIIIVVQRGRGFRDVTLCRMRGLLAERPAFEQAAASIAKRLSVRVEDRKAHSKYLQYVS